MLPYNAVIIPQLYVNVYIHSFFPFPYTFAWCNRFRFEVSPGAQISAVLEHLNLQTPAPVRRQLPGGFSLIDPEQWYFGEIKNELIFKELDSKSAFLKHFGLRIKLNASKTSEHPPSGEKLSRDLGGNIIGCCRDKNSTWYQKGSQMQSHSVNSII